MEVEIVNQLADVPAAAWDALVPDDDPFLEHGFLAALEESGCVGGASGWIPCHLLLRASDGRLAAALPLYLKQHSFGEYIFDWGWAAAAERAGIAYYPKLVSAVPFTPAGRTRLLVAADVDRRAAVARLLEAARELARACEASSIHLLFTSAAEQRLAAEQGYLPRQSYQFHWHDEGYASFGDYLATFRSSARRSARRERRQVQGLGLELSTVDGPQLDEASWRALYRFYRDTTGRKWGRPYLNRAFFQLLRRKLAHRVLATLAARDGRAVAGALLFHKGGSLYGRYWGSVEQHRGLHFELCYYRPIELSIARGWTRFEAGAQGEHKLKRGLLPRAVHSAHLLRDTALHRAVASALARERQLNAAEMAELAAMGPFRREAR